MQPCVKAFSGGFNFSYICLQVGGKKLQTNVWKLKMQRNAFQHSYIPQIWRTQSFAQYVNSAVHTLFRIYSKKKLFVVRFPYKHGKFGADMSFYPECNAWRHLFVYRGLDMLDEGTKTPSYQINFLGSSQLSFNFEKSQ